MFKTVGAAFFVTTALVAVPALAQSNGSHQANSATQEFVTKAAIGGMFEIQSSQIALQKSQDHDIRTFAQKVIDDHTKADDKLKSLAKGENLPSTLDNEHLQLLTKLRGESGSQFLDDFKQAQVSAHQEAIDLFQSYAQSGTDQPIKQFAQQTLPTLKQHLQMAQEITIASNAGGAQQTAQNGTTSAPSGMQQSGGRAFITQQAPGTWQASKLIGVGVYNQTNEKVGSISDVLLDQSGRATGVVIGVGGFLGLGERSVAVPFDALKWSMAPVSQSAANESPNGTTASSPGLGGSVSSTNPTSDATRNTDRSAAAYPDHALLANASKDQLQSAPEFKYGSAPR